MPQNVSLERSQKQKHFGTSFLKIGTAVAEVRIADFETKTEESSVNINQLK